MRPRDIDRYGHTIKALVKPSLLVLRNIREHVVVDVGDKTVLFKDGDELSGSNEIFPALFIPVSPPD